jgi:hypothetical protein
MHQALGTGSFGEDDWVERAGLSRILRFVGKTRAQRACFAAPLGSANFDQNGSTGEEPA